MNVHFYSYTGHGSFNRITVIELKDILEIKSDSAWSKNQCYVVHRLPKPPCEGITVHLGTHHTLVRGSAGMVRDYIETLHRKSRKL